MAKFTFLVDGMSCAACSAAVEKALKRVHGVQDASVNLATGTAMVQTTSDEVTVQQLCTAVKKAGFGCRIPTEEEEEPQTESTKNNNPVRRVLLLLPFAIPLLYLAHTPKLPLPFADFLGGTEFGIYNASLQILLLIPLLIGAKHIYKKGISSVIHRTPGMDALVTFGTLTATVYSLYLYFQLLQNGGSAAGLYFGSAGMILTFVMLGKALEENSRNKTAVAIRSLLALRPQTANLIRGEETLCVAATALIEDDVILVKPGEKFPADGIICNGTADCDESMLTGESIPVPKETGDTVFCGTSNLNGALRVRVTKSAKQTLLAGIIRTVEQAQSSKAPIARLADKISGIFAPAVFCIALVTGIAWFFASKDFTKAITAFISVLVIACPCALGLATPTAIIAATGRGAKNGILLRDGETLQKLASVNTAVFDKTGTLTTGTLTVTFIQSDETDERELLSLTASAESVSEHPVAKAILAHAEKCNIAIKTPQNFTAIPGRGISATIDNCNVAAGNRTFMQELGISIPNCHTPEYSGVTLIFIAVDGVFKGVIGAADTVRTDAKEALEELRKMNIETVLITGDNEDAAKAVLNKLPIDSYHANVLPEGKSTVLDQLHKQGKTTVFVGDGINDAPALAVADVGLAMGSGTDIAMDTADAVLLRNDIRGVVSAITLSKRTMRIIKQNLAWAFGYNILMIPSAAGLLTAFGLPMPDPIIAAAAMSLSSVAVVTNSLRLLKNNKKGEKQK